MTTLTGLMRINASKALLWPFLNLLETSHALLRFETKISALSHGFAFMFKPST